MNFIQRFADNLQNTLAPDQWLSDRLVMCGIDRDTASVIARVYGRPGVNKDFRKTIVQCAIKGTLSSDDRNYLSEAHPGVFKTRGALTFAEFANLVRAAHPL